jgi:ABC-type phosphate transport system substrate-binding protein
MSGHHARPGAQPRHSTHPAIWAIAAVIVLLAICACSSSTTTTTTGPVLADIFLGQITRWNDPAITALNPGLTRPPAAINVVHRSDGSGTTYIFSNYLSSVSPAWAARVGTGKTLKWPVGDSEEGNGGVAQAVNRTPFS